MVLSRLFQEEKDEEEEPEEEESPEEQEEEEQPDEDEAPAIPQVCRYAGAVGVQ